MCGCFLSIALGAIENHKKDNEKESETRSSMFICHENDSSTASVQKKKERKKERKKTTVAAACVHAAWPSPHPTGRRRTTPTRSSPVACHQQPDRGSRQRTPTAPTPTNPNTPRTPIYLRTPTPSGQTRARAVVQLKKSVLVSDQASSSPTRCHKKI